MKSAFQKFAVGRIIMEYSDHSKAELMDMGRGSVESIIQACVDKDAALFDIAYANLITVIVIARNKRLKGEN